MNNKKISKFKVDKSNRGYYDHNNETISLRGDTQMNKNAYHELMHRFERLVPNLLDIEKAFTIAEPRVNHW